jgi:hypothetical protein
MAMLAVTIVSGACSSLEPGSDFFGLDAGVSSLAPAPELSFGDGGADRTSAIAGCPPIAQRPTLRLGAPGQVVEIENDATWTCQNNYLLQAPLSVRAGATLSVGPDTYVAASPNTFVSVERGARLLASGVREAPIVFTSAAAPGARRPGDWRGLVLLGAAASHTTNATLSGVLNDARGFYGGGPEGNLTHDCGRLRYVRVEFAGGDTDEEATPAAALSLAGCGSDTVVDYVQVHRATDGLGLFGGNVNIQHLVVSNNDLGDAVEWTGGYAGRMQYVIAQSSGAAAALKGSNSDADPALLPQSHPIIYNASAIGVRPPIASGGHFGVLLQLGSALTLKNSIIFNFADAGIELRSAQTLASVSTSDVSHVLLHSNGPDDVTHFTSAAAVLDGDSMRDRDPGLTRAARRDRPEFKPTDASVMTDIAIPPAGFDPAAAFRGALPYEGEDWSLDWTAYPLD